MFIFTLKVELNKLFWLKKNKFFENYSNKDIKWIMNTNEALLKFGTCTNTNWLIPTNSNYTNKFRHRPNRIGSDRETIKVETKYFEVGRCQCWKITSDANSGEYPAIDFRIINHFCWNFAHKCAILSNKSMAFIPTLQLTTLYQFVYLFILQMHVYHDEVSLIQKSEMKWNFSKIWKMDLITVAYVCIICVCLAEWMHELDMI